jgi:hypothetical protein
MFALRCRYDDIVATVLLMCCWHRQKIVTDVIDTGDEHKVLNISTYFVIVLNGQNGIFRGLGKLNHEKALRRNTCVRLF